MYIFKYKRSKDLYFKAVKAKGHHFIAEMDRMDVHLADNKGILSLSKWSECDMMLGADFILFQKERMEEEAGQEVKLKK